jgi:predicted permease
VSWWTRLVNVGRGAKVDRELEAELRSHLDEAEAAGRDPAEARRALGGALLLREESRDIKVAAWLDSVRADVVFGVRQLVKNRTASAAAILSLGLAIGACTATFRLVDALLLRPLPVAAPERLFYLNAEYRSPDGKVELGDGFDYPLFRRLRAATKERAELMAISYSRPIDLTFGGDQEMEKAYRQYVSGWTLHTFGLKPAVGRLLTAADDATPGAHPYAVISHEYWTRRFGRDPKAVGKSFRTGKDLYEIVGVLEPGFTGTETGTLTDVYVPTMMNAESIDQANWSWFRIWVQVKSPADAEPARQQIRATTMAVRREAVKDWSASTPKKQIDDYLNAGMILEPAAAGVSGMQKTYRRSMTILAALVGLVLLIACANVANLMLAQATARAREMALRISIGAGRARLVQLVMVESTLVAVAASMLGAVFAWWSAPFVVSLINPPDNPARLILPADWRVLGFTTALALLVAVVFGLAPALRASGVKPASALKGGDDPHRKRFLMNALVAAQVAFCFLVHFVAGLFVASFDRLTAQSTGFAAERLLALEVVTSAKVPIEAWYQGVDYLRGLSGVESAALSSWALMGGFAWRSSIAMNGESPRNEMNPYFLDVAPGWFETMRIPLLAGRDFRAEDLDPESAVVNEAFARRYFEGKNPVGQSFERMRGKNHRDRVTIVGMVRDARYRNMREAIQPTVYVPFREKEGISDRPGAKDWGTFLVRTRGADALAMVPMLRRALPEIRSEFRVSNVSTQAELVNRHTVRERLLAMLSLFFGVGAWLGAGVGLYGVLDYSVLQRRREIGIRMALGARAENIAGRVTAEVFGMLVCGAFVGLGLGVASERFVETLLFGVKATDVSMLVWPLATILAVSLLAGLPPVLRAVRIDPSVMLRAE